MHQLRRLRIRQFLLLLDQFLAIFLQLTGYPLDQLIGLLGHPIPLRLVLIVEVQQTAQALKVWLVFRAIGKWQSEIGFVCQARLSCLGQKGTEVLQAVCLQMTGQFRSRIPTQTLKDLLEIFGLSS